MPATVVLIGESTSAFIVPLRKQYTTYHVRSGKQGLSVAQTHHAPIIVLDAVSLKTNGERICKTLRQALPKSKFATAQYNCLFFGDEFFNRT